MAAPMTYDQIVKALKAEGCTVVQYAGSRDRCRCHTGSHAAGGTKVRAWGPINGTMTHITAGNLGTRTVEQYIASIINGDPNTPCKAQFVVAPNGTVYVNSVGRCNHAGTIGSKSLAHAVAADFPLTGWTGAWRGHDVDGNTHFYGIENIAASSMTAAQREASVRINAAIARFYGWDGGESVGHGECSDQRGYADPNLDMGKFRADVRARVKAGTTSSTTPAPDSVQNPVQDPVPTSDPKPTPVPDDGVLVETISANLAGYDKVHGMANRVKRAQTSIPAYFNTKSPLWFHFQECAIDMWPELDKRMPKYARVPQGGKGRESYYLKGAGIRIIEARLLNVEHMLLKDTKEHLVIAWEKEGHRAVDVNFHNENEGSTYQAVQLRDVMNHARDMADKHGIPRANILVTGDSNTKAAASLARLWGWTEAIYKAAKKIDLQYHSTNGWRTWLTGGLTLGRRIDVDITQRDADVLEAEQLYGALTGDHWAHRLLRRLK